MTYDFNQVIDRNGTSAIKLEGLMEHWGRTDLIPLWVADMDFATAPFVTEAIRQRLDNLVLGYTAKPDRYYQANAGNADAVEVELKKLQADYLILESDISDENAVKNIYSAVLERFGRVDILVNNAADCDVDGLDTIEKITPQVIDDTFAVNVKGSILMTGEFVKHRGDSGRIINLSTDAAQIFAGQITYGASKAAMEALTRSVALEVAKYGITVNCVAPGPTQTGWIDDELERAVLPIIPMGQLIQPEDIAETILFLSSHQAKMLTGQIIKVSGGHAL
jgi:3-oxoacyl-[acyl-carrier protein] reductase